MWKRVTRRNDPCSVSPHQPVTPAFPWDDGRLCISWRAAGDAFVYSAIDLATGKLTSAPLIKTLLHFFLVWWYIFMQVLANFMCGPGLLAAHNGRMCRSDGLEQSLHWRCILPPPPPLPPHPPVLKWFLISARSWGFRIISSTTDPLFSYQCLRLLCRELWFSGWFMTR